MKFVNYDAKELEPAIVKHWMDYKINEKVREKNKKGKNFYFLDGPPYTSGRLHLAHAWNYSLKDMAIRYRKMQGFNVWDRNGFDMHGLPTELKVTAKYNLKTKEDIAKFGLDRFIKECMAFSKEMAGYMVNDIRRVGVSLNLDNPYMPITKEFMEGEWGLIKKAYDQKRLYYGEKVLTWCANCETGLAKHECEYETVKENSIFVKLPLKKKKDEFLIIWTTTPWTIPFNLAVMAGPELEYVKVKVGKEKWILAKALAGLVVQAVAGKSYVVEEEFKGQKLEGLEYVHPFESEIPKYRELKKNHPNVHTVILNEHYVDTTAGSGLVHCAPGCGPEDQEACVPYNIPPFNTITENGYFASGLGKFTGLKAKVDDAKIIESLNQEKVLIKETEVEHEYPHCWRCHKPVIFRITKQWFFKIEDLREKMLQNNLNVHWVPETANNSFKSWVGNLKDNSISRQRSWGTPIPIWKCDKCEDLDVISSSAELKKKSHQEPEDLHIPWIDKITYPCKCGGTKKRVPDIIDVWIDAGTASWNCLNNDPKLIKEWYPADLILEAKEQTRLWFSMLSICSQIAFNQNCYQNVYVYGMLTDIQGRKMSKSLGNIISPYELIDKHGADVLRYYMCQNNAGEEINFNWEECAIKSRQLNILWNIHRFLISLAKEQEINPFQLDFKSIEKNLDLEEKYIFSLTNRTVKEVTELFESYHLDQTIRPIENLYLELSRTYIQMIREKSSIGSKTEKEVCIYTVTQCLMKILKLFAPIAPFITEAMYLNLKEEFKLKEESIHHFNWPDYSEKIINLELEQNLDEVKLIIQAGLGIRESAGKGLRWPLSELIMVYEEDKPTSALQKLKEVVLKQVNVKNLKILKELPGIKLSIKSDYSKIAPRYKELTPKIIAKLAVESPESILSHIEKEGAYKFKIDKKEVEIKKEDLVIDRIVPAPYKEGRFKLGYLYLNLESNADLEAEGYAREIMRQIQQARKDAGLEKKDRINLYLKTNLASSLTKFDKEIKEKVGAEKLEIKTQLPTKKYQFNGQKKIKTEQIEYWFDKN